MLRKAFGNFLKRICAEEVNFVLHVNECMYVKKMFLFGIPQIGMQYLVPVKGKKESCLLVVSSVQKYMTFTEFNGPPTDIVLSAKVGNQESLNALILQYGFSKFEPKK